VTAPTDPRLAVEQLDLLSGGGPRRSRRRERAKPACCAGTGIVTDGATGRLSRCDLHLSDSAGEVLLARQLQRDERIAEICRGATVPPPPPAPLPGQEEESDSSPPVVPSGEKARVAIDLALPQIARPGRSGWLRADWNGEWWSRDAPEDDVFWGNVEHDEDEICESLSPEARYQNAIARTQALQAAALFVISHTIEDQRFRRRDHDVSLREMALEYSRKLGQCGRPRLQFCEAPQEGHGRSGGAGIAPPPPLCAEGSAATTDPSPAPVSAPAALLADGKVEQRRLEFLWLRCPHGHNRFVVPCCQCPLCFRQQRRRSARWMAGMDAAPRLPRTWQYRWRHVEWSLWQRDLVRDEVFLDALRSGDDGGLRRAFASIERRSDETLKLRGKFMRMLRDKYGDARWTGYAKLEMGDVNGMMHVHALVYCRYLPREELQRWLRERDCTVPGCQHPPDDRCEECQTVVWFNERGERKVGRACTHPERLRNGGLRQRCNGSWTVHINEPYEEGSDGERMRGTAGANRELGKYICQPFNLACDDDGGSSHAAPVGGMSDAQFAAALGLALRGEGPLARVFACALREMSFQLVLSAKGRHCFERYGLARDQNVDEQVGDDVEPDGDAETRPCERCAALGNPGQPMRRFARGIRSPSGYSFKWAYRTEDGCERVRWARPPPGS
jgi:hypothetical protein